ncbi:MAG: ribose 5-phosphate isomerase B [Bacteroidales bacterium]|nr:ribose 5-phosphate isomerase B [Bacteroidales bacterium]
MFDKNNILPIGSDHAGYKLKEFLFKNLIEEGYNIKDYGTNSENSVDYPDIIHPLVRAVNENKFNMGIIICGSGQGASMIANKYPEIRAALCWNEEQAKVSRLHNNANIISLPGRYIEFNKAFDMVKIFLTTEFEGGRHIRRVKKINNFVVKL